MKTAIAILISLQPPTGPMETEATSAGVYEHKTNQQKYPRLQLRTVKELMEGKGIKRPFGNSFIKLLNDRIIKHVNLIYCVSCNKYPVVFKEDNLGSSPKLFSIGHNFSFNFFEKDISRIGIGDKKCAVAKKF